MEQNGRWRVAKRPGLDAFLKEMAQLYEIVVFTDSMGGLADEVRERERHVRSISERLRGAKNVLVSKTFRRNGFGLGYGLQNGRCVSSSWCWCCRTLAHAFIYFGSSYSKYACFCHVTSVYVCVYVCMCTAVVRLLLCVHIYRHDRQNDWSARHLDRLFSSSLAVMAKEGSTVVVVLEVFAPRNAVRS